LDRPSLIFWIIRGFRFLGNFEQTVKNPEKVGEMPRQIAYIYLALRVLYAR
jgi:hypothetical protein